jgi:hypothetical protein
MSASATTASPAVASLPRDTEGLFVAAEAGRRNRRTGDGVLLAVGAIVLGLAAAIASSAPSQDRSIAFAIAITHRLCTYYLPPVWGYFSLQWLRHRGNV